MLDGYSGLNTAIGAKRRLVTDPDYASDLNTILKYTTGRHRGQVADRCVFPDPDRPNHGLSVAQGKIGS